MLDQLSDKLQALFKDLRGHGKLSEQNIADTCREIRMALLEADVNFSVAKELVEKIRTRALGTEVLQSITPGQQMVKVFHDELVSFLGTPPPLATGSPLKLLLCGLQGSGKTTTCAKLGLWLKKQGGRKPLLVACDLQRPAAVAQLESLAKQNGLEFFSVPGETDPVKVARAALDYADTQLCNAVLFDTAGRLDIDDALLEQLRNVHAAVKPQESFFVADAAMGQKAVEIVARFKETVALTGLILTRLDGDARGGAALSMRHTTGLPIQFLGTGERSEQMERLDPARLAGRILGMGDIVGLVEKAQEAFDLQDAARLEEKLKKQGLDLDDMLAQLQQLKKLGPLENLLGMIPGAPKVEDSSRAEKQLKRSEAILLSMTRQERRNPDLINARRRQRIAKGSGTAVSQVNELLLQYSAMRKLMKNQGKMKKLFSQFGMKA